MPAATCSPAALARLFTVTSAVLAAASTEVPTAARCGAGPALASRRYGAASAVREPGRCRNPVITAVGPGATVLPVTVVLVELPWLAVLCQPRPVALTKATREPGTVPDTTNPSWLADTVRTCNGERLPATSLPAYRQTEPATDTYATASLRPVRVRPGRMTTKADPVAASPVRPAVAPWPTGTLTGCQVPPLLPLRHRPGDWTLTMILRFPRCSTTGREISPPTMITPPRYAAQRSDTMLPPPASSPPLPPSVSAAPLLRCQPGPVAEVHNTGLGTPLPAGPGMFWPTARKPD